MRAMQKPAHDPRGILNTCIESIANQGLRARLTTVTQMLVDEGDIYNQKAHVAQLYTIPPDTRLNHEKVRSEVTKTELKSVYSDHFVAKKKVARDIYQALLDRAPLGLCPLCGFGHAETLDHYLSKTGYPQFSVFPLNLVPACKSCNHVKLDAVATSAGKQPLHPYYDHGHYISDQWLYAEVRESTPLTIRYYVVPPQSWDAVSKERIISHFSDFQLSRRFGIQASSELAELRNLLTMFCKDEASRRARLAEQASVSRSLHANCWKTALYNALACSDWYCRDGYAVG